MYAARRKTRKSAARRPRFWVWLAYTEQCYGGPEEGGWWYDATQPAKDHPSYVVTACRDKSRALAEFRRLQDRIGDKGLNYGKRKPWSVLSEGDWLTVQMAPSRPHCTPTRHPHYE